VRWTQSDRLPSSPFIRFLRWWLPAIVVVGGLAVMVIRGFDDIGLEGGAGIIGAGLSIWLMNWLWRIGISGDEDRDTEDAARAHFDRTGRWPDEEAPTPTPTPPPARPVHRAAPAHPRRAARPRARR
jgi:hypothetical protein